MSRFDDLIQHKVRIIIGASLILLTLVGIHAYHESYEDSHQVVTVGVLVKVRFGYYTDCKGPVLREVYSEPVRDRNDVLHPSIFAGYAVDLTCNNEHTGDRFFTPDFLRVIR